MVLSWMVHIAFYFEKISPFFGNGFLLRFPCNLPQPINCVHVGLLCLAVIVWPIKAPLHKIFGPSFVVNLAIYTGLTCVGSLVSQCDSIRFINARQGNQMFFFM